LKTRRRKLVNLDLLQTDDVDDLNKRDVDDEKSNSGTQSLNNHLLAGRSTNHQHSLPPDSLEKTKS